MGVGERSAHTSYCIIVDGVGGWRTTLVDMGLGGSPGGDGGWCTTLVDMGGQSWWAGRRAGGRQDNVSMNFHCFD